MIAQKLNIQLTINIQLKSLHYNGSNSFLFVKATKIYQFKGKDPEIKIYTLCLGNISGEVSANNVKKGRIKWICVRCLC